MGEQIRWSVSVDKETDAIAEILQRTYAEYVGSNRSRLVQFLFKRFHRMAGNLAAALEQEQRINQAISSEEITTLNNSSQIEFPAHIAAPIAGPKPLVRVPSKVSANRRRISGLSQMGGLVEMGAWVPPFLGRMRPFKSNSFRQVA